MKEFISQIAIQQNWTIQKIIPVHGGDINQAFLIETSTGKFFVKLNEAGLQYPQMFQKEANGLAALQNYFPLKVPTVVAIGQAANASYLVLEWLQPAQHNPQTWAAFGSALAQLHQTTQASFGWPEATFIASIVQTNAANLNWASFYTIQRIMPLVERLRNENTFTKKEVQLAENFCRRFEESIPTEPPALLHGDLWSGNMMATIQNNQVTTAIFDPDVFYGHREIDIAMTKLFGGFAPAFYTAYHEAYPLQNGWQQRLPVFQLYPLLVHAVLFGGSYVSRVKAIIDNG